MYQSKFIQVITALTTEEKRNFKKFANADFVNKNEDIKKFILYVLTRRKITATTVSKENMHAFLYPGTPYNDLRIRHLLWMSTELLNRFIGLHQIDQNDTLKRQLWLDFYIQKEAFLQADKTIEEILSLSEKSKLRNADFYLTQYQTYSKYYTIHSKKSRSEDFKIQEIVDNLSVFAIAELLKNACIAVSVRRILETDVAQQLLQWIMPNIPDSPFWNYTLLRIYYQTLILLSEDKDPVFDLLLQEVKENESLFSKSELRELYLMFINYSIRKSNQNLLIYTQKTFDLYFYVIEKEYIIEKNEISRFSFTNVVTLGIKLQEFVRTEYFIVQFNHLIHEEYRKNTTDYNNAKLLYAKEKPLKALDILMNNEFKDTLWNLNAKFLLLKIAYELNDIDMLRKQLQLFKVYISRKKNIGYHREYFTKVVDGFKQLLEIRKHPKLYKDYQFDTNTPDMEWFNKAIIR